MAEEIVSRDKGNSKDVNALFGINEGYMFLDIWRAIYPLINPKGILVDIGHGKNLEFPVRMAQTIERYFPKKEMVYYDNSDPEAIRGWLDLFGKKSRKGAEKRTADLVEKAIEIAGEVPDIIHWVDSSKKYLGRASEVCQFFTWHHFENPEESINESYEIAAKGGIAIVIDYDFKRQIKEMSREQAEAYVRSKFNTSSELKVIESEPDWFEAHTKLGLEDCVRHMIDAGFMPIDNGVFNEKVFYCVGKK